MKKNYCILIALFLFAGLNYLNGQDSLLVDPSKIDSLKRLIESATKADKEKVTLLNEYARLCFYNQEYKEGLIAAREVRELSKKTEFESGLILYHLTLGIFVQRVGALTQYHQLQAAMIATQKGDKALLQMKDIPNDYPYPLNKEKLNKLQGSLEYFTELGDKEIQATILYVYAVYNNQNNQPDKSYRLLDQFIALYKSMSKVEPVILGFRQKLAIAQTLNNQAGIDSIKHELTTILTQIKNEPVTGWMNFQLANIYNALRQYAAAIVYFTNSADFFEKIDDANSLQSVYGQMVEIYTVLELHSKRAEILELIIQLFNKTADKGYAYQESQTLYANYQNAIWANYNSKKYDKAREYINLLLKNRHNIKDSMNLSLTYLNAQKDHLEGQILMDQGRYDDAIALLLKAYSGYTSYNSLFNRNTGPWAIAHASNCYYQKKDYQAALKYAILCSNTARATDFRLNTKINLLLADIYDALGQNDKAYVYLKKHQDLVKETKYIENAKQIFDTEMNLVLEKSNEQIHRLEQESQLKEQKNKNQQLWIFSITGALLSALLVVLILYRNSKSRQKANTVLQKTLSNLKSAQSQLIQSEKMASLGELTAGIAHEIQNPLNFVNNFSEVNSELIVEMKQEIDKGNLQEVKSIADSIDENEQKIIVHGKRADAIVKGMLQHSRNSSGQKEPTDINLLADEYLRLAYHGLRAKDKSFNANFKTDFDQTIGKINIVPQDIGRVVLNLINNAFYAVDEKQKQNLNGYEPTVIVSTKKDKDKIEIKVKDNGNGIAPKNLDKIFQPFFTTKPTGKGTGLGLSLAYDIITKGHGGELKVDTKEGAGSEFIIQLPAF